MIINPYLFVSGEEPPVEVPTPVSLWTFNDGSGDTAADTYNVMDLIHNDSNTPTNATWGSGYAVLSRGQDFRPEVFAHGELSAFSVVWWIEFDALDLVDDSNNADTVFLLASNGDVNDYSSYLTVDPGTGLYTLTFLYFDEEFFDSSGNITDLTLTTGKKYTLAFTYDAAAPTKPHFYIRAADAGSFSTAGAFSDNSIVKAMDPNADFVPRCAYGGGAGLSVQYRLHRAEIHDSKLTEEQLNALFAAGSEA